MRVVRIVHVDDDTRFRQALSAVLAADPRVQLVGAAADAAEGLDVIRSHSPDCVLLDVHMSGGGPGAARSFRAAGARAPALVAVSADDSVDAVSAMLEAGVTGYLLKGAIGDVLVDLVLRCVAGEVVLAAPRAALALRSLLDASSPARGAWS